jgi:hypothetical protein
LGYTNYSFNFEHYLKIAEPMVSDALIGGWKNRFKALLSNQSVSFRLFGMSPRKKERIIFIILDVNMANYEQSIFASSN